MSKKNAKSVKEFLKDALVPVEEQPYQAPENWVWVRTNTLNEVITGSTPSKKNDEFYGGNIPFIKPADLDQGKVGNEVSEFISEDGLKKSREVPPNSTLICCIGSIGKVGLNLLPCITNQQINALVPNKDVLNPKYNYYYAQTNYFRNELWNRSSATTISIINKSKMSEIPFPLPPLNEQKRIADKVEKLLGKINQAKQLIEEAKETFELRRAAILDKAFRGQLTKNWRDENSGKTGAILLNEILDLKQQKYKYDFEMAVSHGEKKPKKQNFKARKHTTDTVLPRSWTSCSLGDIVYDFRYGTSLKSDYNNEGIPVLRIPNIGIKKIELDDLKYLREKEVDNSNTVSEGDILIIRSNGSKDLVGKCAIVEENCNNYAFASYLIRIRTIGVLPEYVYFLLNSESVRKQFFNKAKSSAGINNINTEELSSTIVPLPPYEEQVEIVKRIKDLLSIEDEAAYRIELQDLFSSISSAVLSKAFRGELGTNDPSEQNKIFGIH